MLPTDVSLILSSFKLPGKPHLQYGHLPSVYHYRSEMAVSFSFLAKRWNCNSSCHVPEYSITPSQTSMHCLLHCLVSVLEVWLHDLTPSLSILMTGLPSQPDVSRLVRAEKLSTCEDKLMLSFSKYRKKSVPQTEKSVPQTERYKSTSCIAPIQSTLFSRTLHYILLVQ